MKRDKGDARYQKLQMVHSKILQLWMGIGWYCPNIYILLHYALHISINTCFTWYNVFSMFLASHFSHVRTGIPYNILYTNNNFTTDIKCLLHLSELFHCHHSTRTCLDVKFSSHWPRQDRNNNITILSPSINTYSTE